VLGDESGYLANENQHMKIAAIEGMWQTEPAPASFNLIGFPDQQAHVTRGTIKIPYLLGLIATRSLDTPLPGIDDLVQNAQNKIERGMKAYAALQILLQNSQDTQAQQILNQYANDLGYALLLKRYTDNVTDASPAQIKAAAWDTVPSVAPLFWSFRVMVACGLFFIVLFATAFILSTRQRWHVPWFLWTAFLSLPLPWLAAEVGWFVAEHGRQPWVIEGILPTFLGASSLTTGNVLTSVVGFAVLYTFLTAIELYLMIKYIRLGPEYFAKK
jgi:cytochrome d ubiquinol oxidase subunit I